MYHYKEQIERRKRIVSYFTFAAKICVIGLIFLGLTVGVGTAFYYFDEHITVLRSEVFQLRGEVKTLTEVIREYQKERQHIDQMQQQEMKQMQQDIQEIKDVFSSATTVEAVITAYAPLDPNAVEGMCYSGDPNVTAYGGRPIVGQTAASRLSPGTRVWIEGYGMRTINDTGGGLSYDPVHIDLVVETRAEAFRIGRHTARAIIFN